MNEMGKFKLEHVCGFVSEQLNMICEYIDALVKGNYSIVVDVKNRDLITSIMAWNSSALTDRYNFFKNLRLDNNTIFRMEYVDVPLTVRRRVLEN